MKELRFIYKKNITGFFLSGIIKNVWKRISKQKGGSIDIIQKKKIMRHLTFGTVAFLTFRVEQKA